MQRYAQYMYSYPHKTAYRPLKDCFLADYLSFLSGPGHSLYLHIPFCQSKCGYCNLFSVTGQNSEKMELYLDAVERQLKQYSALLGPVKAEFSDFTIGGGTPLLLTETQLIRVFSMIKKYLPLSPAADMIIETAPNQTSPEKLKILHQAGVTRVSMGIQSFSNTELALLHRSHNADNARQALALLMSAGFGTVNVDFIYGVPGQTTASFLASLTEAVSYGPQEIFLYPLYVKHGVLLEQELTNGMVLDQEQAYCQYREGAAFLKNNGYCQDSMRRFVKQSGTSCQREWNECSLGSSLSLGCGGRSYLGNIHFCTPYATNQKDCLEQIELYEKTRDFTAITHGYLLSEEEIKRRYLIRHLLIFPGLHKLRYLELFHSQAIDDFPMLKDWLEKGWLEENKNYLSLTQEGLGLSDYLGPQFISSEVRQKMEKWEELHGWKYGSIPGKSEKL